MPRPRRSFDAEFKARVVLEVLSGSSSAAELCRRHNVKPTLLSQWKARVMDGLPSLFGGDESHQRDQSEITDLKQLVGQKTYELELLKKASRLLNGQSSSDGRSW
jgi:transposase-like protein